MSDANNPLYGLQGSVWTDNYRRAMRYAREIECGLVPVEPGTEARNSVITYWCGSADTG